ncbi:MAG: hypothetical protein ACI9CE_000374 [Flavobacterium sp.]|jgi:hypothetical protein
MNKRMKIINVLDFYENNILKKGFLDKHFLDKRLGSVFSPSSHSDLAMAAAKKMRKTRSKEKTGHLVCVHLLDMLSDEKSSTALLSPGALSSSTLSPRARSSKRRPEGQGVLEKTGFWLGANFIKSGDGRQFSLSL